MASTDFGSPETPLTANGVPASLSGRGEVAHTPGPIRAHGRDLINRHGNVFATVYHATTENTDEFATAARIVACVNFCEGFTNDQISDTTLKADRDGYADACAERDALRSRCAALEAALRCAVDRLEYYEVKVEGEWGVGRTLAELSRAKERDPITLAARAALGSQP